jgi:4a-hydroxytetrahydrobiopterin dehydratase
MRSTRKPEKFEVRRARLSEYRFGRRNVEMSELSSRECVPCRGGVPPLGTAEIARLIAELDGWEVVEEHHLLKRYGFKDFREALAFVNRLGQLSEEQGHHPDICFGWGYAAVTIWTHKIDGLTESDFILAAKIDAMESKDEGGRRKDE